ncbi:MAG: hypothetical protein HQL69_05265 [Magnetococcales bacterium]|nr:hypothetical protein [Magnetococcales bacterium]
MMILSEIYKKTLMYPFATWIFAIFDEVTANYVCFSLFLLLYISGMIWLLKDNLRSVLGFAVFFIVFIGGTLFGEIQFYSLYLSHHLLSYGFVIWCWYAFIKGRIVTAGFLFSLAFAVHSPSTVPFGFIFLILLLWYGDSWRERWLRLAKFSAAALPVSIYFLWQVIGSEGGVMFSPPSPEMGDLIRYRVPELVEPLWESFYGIMMAVLFILLPFIFNQYRSYFTTQQLRTINAIAVSITVYLLTIHTLVLYVDVPLIWLLTYRGMDVLVLIQLQILLSFIHRYSIKERNGSLFLFFAVAIMVSILLVSIIGFVASLALFVFVTKKPDFSINTKALQLAAASLVLFYTVVRFYPYYQETKSPVLAVKTAYWELLESFRLEPILLGKEFMPKEWKLSNFPGDRREAAAFIRASKTDPTELIASSWRDNWWVMGYRIMAMRGIYVDWDGSGDVRAVSNQWIHEWYRRYGINRNFFSYDDKKDVSQQRQDWIYTGPQKNRVVWSEKKYTHTTDEQTFLQAAQTLYNENVRWVVNLGPFIRDVDFLKAEFIGENVWVYRLLNPGVTLDTKPKKLEFILPPTWYKVKRWEPDAKVE